MSQQILGTPGNAASLLPPFADFPQPRPSTPPPMQSPLPRTPRPQRILNPPKTPLHKLQTVFGDDFSPLDAEQSDYFDMGMEIERPDSASSCYSSSSSSSIDTQTTYTTAGGSCTSPETEESFFPSDKPSDNPDESAASATDPGAPQDQKRKRHRSGRNGRVEWTEEMDDHLWLSYIACQQDPKITPFFVLPGKTPPLGVCYKVAREAKRTWKEAKLRGDWKSPVTTPRAKRTATPINGGRSVASNRGDAFRKTNPYAWPASQSSTRNRLRLLCKQNYGPSPNPYHHQQQRRPIVNANSRSATISPSPAKPGVILPNSLYTTRSMALSLTTSTASSMRPNGVLASLAAGHDVVDSPSMRIGGGEPLFGGIAERILEGSKSNSQDNATGGDISQNPIGLPGIAGLGLPFGVDKGVNTYLSRPKTADPQQRSGATPPEQPKQTPTLLPPLELSSTKTPYGTWPRRLKRPELQDDDSTDSVPPPKTRPRRGTLCDLFGDNQPALSATFPTKPRARTRGYTISSGTTPLSNKRRARPTAPLLTVTGPVSYDSPRGDSPLAERAGDPGDLPRRLGSPFMERLDRKPSVRGLDEAFASGSEAEKSPTSGKRPRQ